MNKNNNIYQVDLIAALFGGFMITWLATTKEVETISNPNQLAFATFELNVADKNGDKIGIFPKAIAEKPNCAPASVIVNMLSSSSLKSCDVKTLNNADYMAQYSAIQKGRRKWSMKIINMRSIDLQLPPKKFAPIGTTKITVPSSNIPSSHITSGNITEHKEIYGKSTSVFIATPEAHLWLKQGGKLFIGPEKSIKISEYFFTPAQTQVSSSVAKEISFRNIKNGSSSLSADWILEAEICLYEDGTATCYEAKTKLITGNVLKFKPKKKGNP